MLRRRLLARLTTARAFLLIAVAVGMVLAAGAASAAVSHGPAKTAGGIPAAQGAMKKVIVLFRNKHTGLAARSAVRRDAVKAEVDPLAQSLRSHGAKHVSTGTVLPYVVASVSSAQEQALKQNSAVQGVFPDSVIPAPTPELQTNPQLLPSLLPNTASPPTPTFGPGLCGTAGSPENGPEAYQLVNGPAATAAGFTGAGIKVGYIAGPIDPTIPDFQRNAKYATTASPTGSPVVTAVDFSGDADQANVPNGDAAGESFLDASSIAAQGNTKFDLSQFVNVNHPLPKNCDITLTGTAPGADVLGMNVFSATHATTNSNFVEAINYAVANGVKVLNESFGGNPFPDTALDVDRIADDAAVAAGVTVVVSSGDSGVTSTIGSPSTDPNLISVGASTSFRAVEQLTFGGVNATTPRASNGTWIDNNISSFSSGGFAQNGRTVDLVAPGDWNWALCSTQVVEFNACFDENGQPSGLEFTGGTSESAPLTAGAAADVIQAYQSTHNGVYPSPALVKQILISTATDIGAPAEQQGAGLLNVGAAVKEAQAVNGGSGTHHGSLLIGPNQFDIAEAPNAQAQRSLSVTNTGNQPVTVKLSTRALSHKVGSRSGSFCLNPTSGNISCGPPTPNTFVIWSGATEAYQEETFTVPRTNAPSRLNFSSDYPNTGQASLLHVALYDPSGRYAGYSDPQGLADFANIQVADPKPGKWTAVFFTVEGDADQNTGVIPGTHGTIHWEADTWTYGAGGSIEPATLHIAPGASSTATFTVKSPQDPGDTAQSIVLQSSDGTTTTVPVTVRTLVELGHGPHGGTFNGVLTGGNGRGNPAVTNTYQFDVPSGQRDIDVGVELTDPLHAVVAYLTDPEGNTVANSSNLTFDSSGQNVIATDAVNLYKDNPEAGRWTLALDWLPPVANSVGLAEPFTGQIQLNHVRVSSNLPGSAPAGHGPDVTQGTTGPRGPHRPGGPAMRLKQGKTYTFDVKVKNTAQSPETFFLDPRLPSTASIPLPNLNGGVDDEDMTLPLDPGFTFPFYLVPSNTSELQTTLTNTSDTTPVTYDIGTFPGDPDEEASSAGNSASLDLNAGGGELQPGPWFLSPSEIGPYDPTKGAPTVTGVSDNFVAVTQAFDPTVNPSTGDLWALGAGESSTGFAPVYLEPGQSATIPLTITPTASPGTQVSGSIDLNDVFQANFATGFANLSGDELASIPFSYTVK